MITKRGPNGWEARTTIVQKNGGWEITTMKRASRRLSCVAVQYESKTIESNGTESMVTDCMALRVMLASLRGKKATQNNVEKIHAAGVVRFLAMTDEERIKGVTA